MNGSPIKEDVILNAALSYYQQRTNQRMGYFNFFVTFATLLSGGLVTILVTHQENAHILWGGIVAGLLLMICSFVFWRIDVRNRDLRICSEGVIKEIEDKYQQEDLKLFTNAEKTKSMFRNSELFRIIFTVFFLIGFSGVVISIILMCIAG